MSTILRSALPMAAACAIATSAFAVVTPQKITWVGEETGNFADAANWDPAKVPSANSSTKAYIAVFTNSVTVTSLDYWYSGGIEVKNGANVVFTGTGTYRFYPTTADIGGDGDGGTNIVFDVETGSTLKFNGVAFRGLETVTFVKKGGGKFINTSWIGNIYQYRNVDVREGEMELTTTDSRFNLVPRLTVRSGAVFKTKMPGGLTAAHNPSVTIDAGGLYDVGGKALNISHLSGAGTVSNVTTVTITGIGDAVETNLFSGRIYGKLSIAPTAGTPAGSAFIVGATNTLAKSDLSIDISACPTYQFGFAAGLHSFECKSWPSGMTFYDTDGKEVVLASAFWFVDPSFETSGDGTTAETAFATLAEAMSNSALQGSDVVYALPGRYDRGSMESTESSASQTNRVIVKAGVRLISTEGAGNTFIVGAPACVEVEDGRGCGPGAIRCVLLRSGAMLKGFTVTNGFTICSESSPKTGARYGGGVRGGIVEDCVIAGCGAVRGGGVKSSICRRCLFIGNVASDIGAAAYKESDDTTACYNCVFDKHTKGTYVTLYVDLANCTFLPSIASGMYAAWYSTSYDTTVFAKNCLFLCKVGRNQANFQNCAFVDTCGISDANIGEGSIKKTLAELRVKDDGQPRKRSPLIDAGDASLYPVDDGGAYDFAGIARICGETIDIGAFEFDPPPPIGFHFSVR